MQQTEVREHVEHLLLGEIPAPGGAVRRQPRRAQLLFEHVRVGARREEEHDFAWGRFARVAELSNPSGERASLAAPPGDSRVLVALLVGDEQLDRGPLGRVREPAGGDERRVVVAEVRREQLVDDVEQLRPRAVIRPQRQNVLRAGAPLLEDLDVGVPEAVDRLELVADEEQLLGIELIDDLALETVRVLELVDHDRAEAEALAVAYVLISRQEIPGAQLEILEVERALRVLRALVRVAEELEQLLEQVAVAHGCHVQRGLLERQSRVLIGRETLLAASLHRKDGEIEQQVHRRRTVDEVQGASHLRASLLRLIVTLGLGERGRDGSPQLSDAGARSGSCSSPSSSGRPAARSVSATPPSILRRPPAPYVASSLTRSGCSPRQNSASAATKDSVRSTLAWLSSSTRNLGSTPAAAG